MDARVYFNPPDLSGKIDPLDAYWELGWEIELRDGRKFGDKVRGLDLVTADPILLEIWSGQFFQAMRVLAELHRDGHDLGPRTLEYEEAKAARALGGG